MNKPINRCRLIMDMAEEMVDKMDLIELQCIVFYYKEEELKALSNEELQEEFLECIGDEEDLESYVIQE